MRPLNYAILKYLTSVPRACTENVIDALREEYSSFKMLNMKSTQEALMTAEQNSLLEEDGYELDANENLHIYYRVTDYGQKMINQYIK